ncbi:MAG: glycosyltransferase family 2 protein [bacterium]|nr:glycosyltransferase family 2 protein [bacterium]
MKISVIVVNYNTRDLLKDCLNSLFEKNKDVQLEVIVVDNYSSDGSGEMVQKDFPKVVLIENKKNLGFARGNNLGIKKASGEYVLLLNSDTQFVENSLCKMIEFMENKPKIGIASCQLTNKDGTLQASGGFFPTIFRVFAWMFFLDDLPYVSNFIKSFHPHDPAFYTGSLWYQEEHEQDWVTGAFFLMRKKIFQECGGLDENFFMYVEEMEYCYRAKKKGWGVFYTPITRIIHLGGKSGSTKNALLGEYRGLKYFFTKHRPTWENVLLGFFLKIGAVLRIILFGIIKGNQNLRETYVEAFSLA